MKIGLVGWGVETQSVYRYFGSEHIYIIGSEEPREDFPVGDNVTIYSLSKERTPGLTGNVADLSYLDHFDECDIVYYQGAAHKNLEKHFPSDHPFWQKATTSLHLFFEKVATKNIVGVTGTKGKGTTTTLIAEMLKKAGKKVFVGGNIGIPTLDFLDNVSHEDWVVLELSSFQLYKFPYSPHIAVHLMMMHEHIDEWHKTMDDYVEAKRNIFLHQKNDDIAVYHPLNTFSTLNVSFSRGIKIPYLKAPGAHVANDILRIDDVEICHASEIKLLGKHNIENICAAITAVWNITKDTESIREVVRTFSGLEHRLEFVREREGIRYYDDSFGTTPDTALVAMDAFEEPKVMIIGGHEKGNPMDVVAQRLAQADIRHAVCIGLIGKKIYDLALLQGADAKKLSVRDDGNSWTMEEIVDECNKYAKNGDVVLLSAGSSSFGIFKDYKDRGHQFKEVVTRL